MFLSASPSSITEWIVASPRERREWSVFALPLRLFELLQSRGEPLEAADPAYLSDALRRHVKNREVARRWPQRVGYRAALRLAERGCVAFALVSGRDLRRATRSRVGIESTVARRVEPAELLDALKAAGSRLPREVGR